MATPSPPQSSRSSEGSKKNTPPSSVVTRNSARMAKIQTRAMASGAAKPSAAVLASKKRIQQQRKKHSGGDTVLRDYFQVAMDSKTRTKGLVGFVTEPRMAEHRCLWDENYPECPERLIGVIDRCNELNLIEQCKQFQPRMATKDEVLALHAASVYDMMETTDKNEDLDYLEELSSRYDAVYIHPSSHELSLISAGSTIDMVDAIINGDIEKGCAFIRPPGHHAMRAEPCGYCFYNNMALAANKALDKGVKRILIVDWDVHHGQATQQMFYDDDRVVYFSIHRYEHGTFWPNLRHSDFHYVGSGRGKGYTFNLPLNQTGMTDADYLAIWHQVLMPMAFEFCPELVLVSAGFDSAIGDEKGEMLITPACYAHLTHMLMSITPSVCVVLEGGYCIPSLAEGAALTLRTLLGHPPPKLQVCGEPCDSIVESILNCIYAHKPYWNCYNFQPIYSIDTTVPNVCDQGKQKHTVSVKFEGDETRPEKFATRDCYPLQDDDTKRQLLAKIHNLRITTDLSLAEHKVSYVYDPVMLKHKSINEPDHPECPERILRIHERHRDYGLLSRVHHLQTRMVTDEEILAVHTSTHLERLKELSTLKARELIARKEKYDSVYFHPDTFECAAYSAGSTLQAVDAVMNRTSSSAVCIIRPPGHHADEDTPSGFCLLNNVVIAAKYAIAQHCVERVLVLDWDVHHGNGTQALTYDDDKILYVSMHRYDNGSFFPHSTDANYDKVGAGRGEGFNVNVPWNKRGMGDVEYIAVFTQIVLPIAYEYTPQLVIVSAGFDACVTDPLGGCKVTPECYARMTQLLQGLAGGRVILCLEGGYNTTAISYAMTFCTKALLGDPILTHYEPKTVINCSAIESINEVIKTHKKYWKNLKFYKALPLENVLEEPLPSRGLIINEQQDYCDTDKSETSMNISCKSGDKSLDKSTEKLGNLSMQSEDKSMCKGDTSLENAMSDLKLNKECTDGIHCGGTVHSDDEEDGHKVTKAAEVLNLVEGQSLLQVQNLSKKTLGKTKGEAKPDKSQEKPEKVEAFIIKRSQLHINSDKSLVQQATNSEQISRKDSKEKSLGTLKIKKSESDIEKTDSITKTTDSVNITTETEINKARIADKLFETEALSGEDPNVVDTEPKKIESDSKNIETNDESTGASETDIKRPDYFKTRSSVRTSDKQEPKRTSAAVRTSENQETGRRSTANSPETSPRISASTLSMKSVRFTESSAGPSHSVETRTSGDSEAKTLEEFLGENMEALQNEEMFAVVPLTYCKHLEELEPIPADVRFEQDVKCLYCSSKKENWYCLHCYVPACARLINAHMQKHYRDTHHHLILSVTDLSVWCNTCDAYIDHAKLYEAKNNAYKIKFGEEMPYTYREEPQLHLE